MTLAAEGRPLPYVYLEISAGSGEALSERDFYGVGYGTGGAADITEFTFTGVASKFRGVNGEHISQLDPNGPAGSQFSPAAWGLMAPDKGVVFLQNHDTQHECGIGYRDGDAFRLANVWMLAQPYGYPSILSSYAFNCPIGNSMGPPSDPGGLTKAVACASDLETAVVGQWVCEHRDPMIAAMVGFRRTVAGTAIMDWWDNGANAIAFTRGDRGFVALNNETTAVAIDVATPLVPGTYCNILSGGAASGCAGGTVTVDTGGRIVLNLAARSAVAIVAGAGPGTH
jgi:alpha-amylase